MRELLQRYQGMLRAAAPTLSADKTSQQRPEPQLYKVAVCTRLATEALDTDTRRDYNVSVSAAGAATIDATTVYGAMAGLESLLQLVDVATGAVRGLPLRVEDAPRFRHRGLLVDTSRHYLPLGLLQRTIDGMASTKLSALHWHITDSISFPAQSVMFPNLSRAAACECSNQLNTCLLCYPALFGLLAKHRCSLCAQTPRGQYTRCSR
jgi:hexosaminidase